jgi:molecular chaperone DnaJ
MSTPDYYKVLGVSKTADVKQIKRAYRKLALKHHPDKNPDDPKAEDLFKNISEAYTVLSDPGARRRYDAHGDPNANPSAGFPGGFGDIFNDIFNSRRTSRPRHPTGPLRGADVNLTLTIEFMDAVHGCQKKVTFDRSSVCTPCTGTGQTPGTGLAQCSPCRGTGNINFRQGPMMVQTTCKRCRGHGFFPANPCNPCSGTGLKIDSHDMTVNIPAGINSGNRLRLAGQGNAGHNGGPSGDVMAMIKVIPSSEFKREGFDIHTDLGITFTVACLGGEADVKTVHGIEKIKIPAGTQPNTMLRVHDKGVQNLRSSGHGSHYLHINVSIPRKLTKKQHLLLKNFYDE